MEVQDEWYQGERLEGILCLTSHEEKMIETEIQEATVNALRILFYLVTSTDFFGVKFDREETYDVDIIQYMTNNLDFVFVGRLVIKLFYIIYLNSFHVRKLLLFFLLLKPSFFFW